MEHREGPQRVSSVGVHAEHAIVSDRGEENDRRDDEQNEREPQPPQRRDEAKPVGRKRAEDDCDRHDRVLDPRQHGERCEHDEQELRAARRVGADVDARAQRSQHQRIRERIGEHRSRVYAVRHGDGQRRDADPEPACKSDPPGKQVSRERSQRDLECVHRLREPPRRLRTRGHEPDRRGEDRLEQRREVDPGTSNHRPPVLCEATRQRRIDVLVRQVVRRDPTECGEEPPTEARHDDSGEPRPRGDGGGSTTEDPRKELPVPARPSVLARGGDAVV